MTIRIVKKSDLDVLAVEGEKFGSFLHGLDSDYDGGPAIRQRFLKYLKDTSKDRTARVLVAKDRNEILGFIIGVIEEAPLFLDTRKIGKILLLYVKENYRHQGIGKSLFQSIIPWFKRSGINLLELAVDIKNYEAVQAWKKLGFEASAYRMKQRI